MSKEITASEWVALTRDERVALCRRLAGEAETLAKSAEPKFQQGYSEVAAGWHRLAAEIVLSTGTHTENAIMAAAPREA